jgi:TonB family protein
MDNKNVVLGENKKKSKYGYLLYLALFLSVLFHVFFVSFSLRYSFQKHANALFSMFTKALTSDEKKQLPIKRDREKQKVLFALNPKEQKQQHEERVERQKKVMEALSTIRTSKRVAKLTPGKSNFGWVIFDREPTKVAYDAKPEIPTTIDGVPGQALLVQATEQKPAMQKAIAQAQKVPLPAPKVQQAPIAHEEKQAQPVQKVINEVKKTAPLIDNLTVKTHEDNHEKDIWAELEKEMATIKQEEPKKTVPKIKEPERESTQQRIKKIADMQKRLEMFSGSGDSVEATKELLAAVWAQPEGADMGIEPGGTSTKTSSSSTGDNKEKTGIVMAEARGARSMNGEKKRNIIALTRGFVEQTKDLGGTDSLERDGDSSIRPTLDELKYLSYETKLNWCLQAAWKQNFGYNRYDRVMEGSAVIEFTIDEHGNLMNSKLLRPTGIAKLDSMIMKTTELAAPFPPLPKFFGTPTYTTGRIIHVGSNLVQF